MVHDVVIVGGGLAGLAAALTLGRAREKVLLCDAGPRRKAAAEHLHNFVTRDGTTPQEFRRTAREQLEPYRTVDVRDVPIRKIEKAAATFRVILDDTVIESRR